MSNASTVRGIITAALHRADLSNAIGDPLDTQDCDWISDDVLAALRDNGWEVRRVPAWRGVLHVEDGTANELVDDA